MGRPERVERSVADLPTLQSIAGGFGFVLEVKCRSIGGHRQGAAQ